MLQRSVGSRRGSGLILPDYFEWDIDAFTPDQPITGITAQWTQVPTLTAKVDTAFPSGDPRRHYLLWTSADTTANQGWSIDALNGYSDLYYEILLMHYISANTSYRGAPAAQLSFDTENRGYVGTLSAGTDIRLFRGPFTVAANNIASAAYVYAAGYHCTFLRRADTEFRVRSWLYADGPPADVRGANVGGITYVDNSAWNTAGGFGAAAYAPVNTRFCLYRAAIGQGKQVPLTI